MVKYALVLPALFLTATAALGQTTPAPATNKYGVDDDIGNPTSQTAMDRARAAGFGWVHLYVYWTKVNPAPGVYDWSALDLEMSYIRNAGLNAFLRVIFPPAWATGVTDPEAARPYFCYDENNPPSFVKTGHSDCLPNNGKIPQAADFTTFVNELLARYYSGPDAPTAIGFGVEQHNPVFWHGTAQDFVDRILVPGYQAVKAFNAAIQVVGPDEDLESSLADLLAKEQNVPGGRFADILSFHVLQHSTAGGDVIARLDSQLKPVYDIYSGGRPMWITEFGTASHDTLSEAIQGAWLQEKLAALTSREWIEKVFIYRLKHVDAGPDHGLLAYDDSRKQGFCVVSLFLGNLCPTTASYLAEGASGGFFDLDIAIANPTATSVPLRVTFLKPDGSTVVQTPTINALSRMTLKVDEIPEVANTAVSAVVESLTGTPVVVERSMFWDAGYYGGHTGTAVVQPHTQWYFGEGSQGFFDTFVLLANSNPVAANVTVTFLREVGPPVVTTHLVGPTSRLNVWANEYPDLRDSSFSIVVSSDQPIIAERAMYFGAARFWDGGHESAGVNAPSTTWFHAEGATGAFFDTYILIGNPNGQPATVTLTYLLETGQTVVRQHTIAPNARLTVPVESEDPLLAEAAVSTTVSSDVPVISERAMYWPGSFTTWAEAHNSFGVTETATRWGLAEGRVGMAQGFETYILLANAEASPAIVLITFLKPDGTTVVKPFTVGPTTRRNVWVNGEVPELANTTFGAVVDSVNGVPISVERALYWNTFGQTWAGGTNATATRLP
jgi:hypothetical protein